VAVLVVHHLRKLSAADPMDEISGSTGLSGGVDGFLILKRDRGRHDATLHVGGRDVEEPAELALKWDAKLAAWTLVGDAEEYRMTQDRAEIIDILLSSPRPMTPKEVAAALGKKPENVGQRLYQMRQAGQVSSPDRGLYTVHKDDKDDKDEPGTGKGDSADLTDLTNLIGGEENGPRFTSRETDQVRALLADPPEWLAVQYREDPVRLKKPTCTAVATEVFGTAQRWREVVPILDEDQR
jgi:hypothetical protein